MAHQPAQSTGRTELTRQASLTRSTERQAVNYERKRGIECPDCGVNVSASKGSHALPDDAPAERVHGWACDDCQNVFPSHTHDETAPGFNDRMVGVLLTFRDGSERYVPVAKSHVRNEGDAQ